VTIKAGQANPRHRHPNCDEILHLISGRLEHTLGDERMILELGDSISIPTASGTMGPRGAKATRRWRSRFRRRIGKHKESKPNEKYLA
jgi:uncharacterized cupin superfamily protein